MSDELTSGNGDNGDDQAVLPFDDGSAGRVIRREWQHGRWFFSVVDVIAVLTDSETPRRYWSDLKRKLHDDEGFSELYAKIVQLKLWCTCTTTRRPLTLTAASTAISVSTTTNDHIRRCATRHPLRCTARPRDQCYTVCSININWRASYLDIGEYHTPKR